MAETSISMIKTYFIAGISEPFDEPPFCFDKVNKHQESLSITDLFAGASDYLPPADTCFLHIHCTFHKLFTRVIRIEVTKNLARISCILLHLKCTALIMNTFHVVLDIQAIDWCCVYAFFYK